MRGKKHDAVWTCINKRKSSSDYFYFLYESHRWLVEIENVEKKRVNFCLKMSGKR